MIGILSLHHYLSHKELENLHKDEMRLFYFHVFLNNFPKEYLLFQYT